MMFRKILLFNITGLLIIVMSTFTLSGDVVPTKPSKKDKCPVCGMFVAKYPDWVGEIIYNDGMIVFSDGVKDLFKYYFNIQKYHPRKKQTEIKAIFVSEYYDLAMINAYNAYYVIGSDVFGPMGRELIPLKNEAEAKEFLKDHQGKRIVRFKDVTTALLATLD